MFETTQIFPRRGSVCSRCEADRSVGEEHGAGCPLALLSPIPETEARRDQRRLAIMARNARVLALRMGSYS